MKIIEKCINELFKVPTKIHLPTNNLFTSNAYSTLCIQKIDHR